MNCQTAAERHPRGLYVLFFTEMWERFSYYLMIGIFFQYLVDSQTGGMAWTGKHAASVVGSYLAGVYFTPFLGGILAERVLGYRRCVVIGGAFMGLGHVLLAMPGEGMLYLALLSLVIGNGLFKPSMSTLVGRLYPAGSALRDRGYTIFYMGVNLGAFICNFVAALVRNSFGWHWAFGTAGVGMAIGIVVFLAGSRYVRGADMTAAERASRPVEPIAPLFVRCLGPAMVTAAVGYLLGGSKVGPFSALDPITWGFLFACVPVVVFYLRTWSRMGDVIEKGRVGALLAVYAVVIVFWMVFKQNSTALTEWARASTDREPSGLVAPVTALRPEFSENAPPDYFYNAGPDVARPDPSTYAVIADAEYEALKQAKKLAVADGQPTPVTQDIFDKVYAGAAPGTPTLPPGRQLELVNTELMQSINPGFIILFSPLMVALWAWLSRRRREPSMPGKIGAGLFITGLSALVMVGAAQAAGDGGKASAWWLFGTYGVVTIGELCLSPIGLSMISRFSPRHITAFMMGGWYISIAIGNKLSGVFGGLYFEWDKTVFFLVNAVVTIVAAGVTFAMLPWLRRQFRADHDATPGEPREASAEVAAVTMKRAG